jgi:magnesium chelatase accessory protein
MNWEAARGVWPNAQYSRFIEAAGHRWHVQEAGGGPCMLLLHGAGASTHSWRHLLPDLARDFHVVAPDLPGQGFTRLGNWGRCGLADMSADIATMLAGQGFAPDVIVGHSAGAAIGLRLALDLPEPVKAAVCINPALEDFRGPAGAIFPALARLLSITPLPSFAASRAARFSPTVRTAIASTGSTLDATGVDLYRRLLVDRGHLDATLCMLANWNLLEVMPDLPRLRAPTLFMVGANDRAVAPDVSIRASRRIEGSRVEAFPGFGHLVHEEAPGLVARVIREFVSSPVGSERTSDTPCA